MILECNIGSRWRAAIPADDLIDFCGEPRTVREIAARFGVSRGTANKRCKALSASLLKVGHAWAAR